MREVGAAHEPVPKGRLLPSMGRSRRLVGASLDLRRGFAHIPARTSAIASALFLAAVAVIAVVAPLLPLIDPTQQDIAHRLAPPAWEAKGVASHLLGTDQLGRDVLSRTIYGARISLFIGLACTILAASVGVPLGLLAGMRPRYVGDGIMAIADVLLAFPFLVLAIAITAVAGSSLPILILVLAAFGWVQFARVVRGDVLAIREREFVEASRATGSSGFRIARRHVLPNVMSPIVVIWTFTLAGIILIESALSFLGLGVQPPTPSWGGMLADGRPYIESAWWIGAIPGVLLMITVLAINLLGDAIRDALDPRMRP